MLAGLLLVAAVAPVPVAAVTADDVGAMILDSVNDAREGQGLVAHRSWGPLVDIASARAGRMASSKTLSHTAAGGNVGSALDARGLDWMGYGEAIGMTGYAWGQPAADSLFGMWMDSSGHRALLLSDDYNYIGIGIARASDGSTWASIVLTESDDHTAPVASIIALDRNGTSLSLAWDGSDPRLQTHTAGLKDWDVRFRRSDRRWRTIREHLTDTSLTLTDRKPGHWFLFKVRSRDQRGTLSPWTTATRIWVP
jgi:hypothetical protein